MNEVSTESTLGGLAARDYPKIQYLDADGKLKSTRSNGDAVALALLGLGPNELQKVAKTNGVEYVVDATNAGLARLRFGNSLRAKVKAGDAVTIGEFVVKKLDQKIVPPSIKAAATHVAAKAKEAAAKAKEKEKAEKASSKPARAPRTAKAA